MKKKILITIVGLAINANSFCQTVQKAMEYKWNDTTKAWVFTAKYIGKLSADKKIDLINIYDAKENFVGRINTYAREFKPVLKADSIKLSFPFGNSTLHFYEIFKYNKINNVIEKKSYVGIGDTTDLLMKDSTKYTHTAGKTTSVTTNFDADKPYKTDSIISKLDMNNDIYENQTFHWDTINYIWKTYNIEYIVLANRMPVETITMYDDFKRDSKTSTKYNSANEEIEEIKSINNGVKNQYIVESRSTTTWGAQGKMMFLDEKFKNGNYIYSHKLEYSYSTPTANLTNENFRMEVFPSPADATIDVVLNSGNIENAIIKVITLDGRQVMLENNTLTNSKVSLNVENLKSGIYFIEVKTAKGNKQVKFVKN